MAALPALIASATIVYTTIFPNYIKSKEDAIVASTTSMSTSPSLGSFLMGFSVGISISWMIGYEAKRRRLWETVRFKILSWVYDNTSILHDGSSSPQQHSTLRLADKFRTPALLASLEGVPISPSDVETGNQHGGETLDVLSAHWTVSSGLHVNVLSLSSGSELIPHPANGMEFFFIIKGNGKFHRDGDVFEVIAGYGWISDPGSIRGFTAGGRNGLVILRATDTPTTHYDEQNMARRQNNSLSSVMSLLSAGLNKAQQYLEESNEAMLSPAYSGLLGNLRNIDQ